MTITQALLISLLIGLWATGNGVDLSNNTIILIILAIALIALSFATTQRNRCQNSFINSQNGLLGTNLTNFLV